MAYQDSVNTTPVSEAYLDEANKQNVMKYASAAARTADATLGAALREGMLSYLDDLNVLQVYSGAAWSTIGPVHGALTAWTPAIVQLAGVTATVNQAWYERVGRLVTAQCVLTVTGSGSASNLITVSLPVASIAVAGDVVGQGYLIDASASGFFPAIVVLHTTTTVRFNWSGASASSEANSRMGTGSILTVALASGDEIHLNMTYQAAADA